MSGPGHHRTFSLRTWLALALGTVFAVPMFVTLAYIFHVLGIAPPDYAAATAVLRTGAGSWHDPAWQAAASEELAAHGVAVVLLEDGRAFFRTGGQAAPGEADGDEADASRTLTVIAGEREQTALLYPNEEPWATFSLVPLVALASLLATVIAIAWFLGRTVTTPLAALSRAARQVAAGDLDIAVPSSRVREVSEVSTAFAAMSVELGASLRQRAALEQERRLFIGAVVHDLRTPLFSLRGYLEGLGQGMADTPAKRARYIAGAQEKAAALERLVTDLFSYTRLEYLDQAPNREPLDLAPLVSRLVDGLQAQAATKRVTLTMSQAGGSCLVEGDTHLLTRAIENLLDNAIRYTAAGGDVRVQCQPDGDHLALTVADTGPGIAPDDLPHLFAPLYRGESSRNRRTGGAGLGLAVARRILRAHGGDLTAANRAPHGAVFTGVLPRPPALESASPDG